MLGASPNNYERFIQGLLTQDEFPTVENLVGTLLLDETIREFKLGKRENEAMMLRGRLSGPSWLLGPPPPRQELPQGPFVQGY